MTDPSYQEIPKLQPSNIQVLPDPIRGWLKRKAKPQGYDGWYPATDAQGAALDCEADILLLGGAAGSLKSSTILVDLIQERDYPRMNSYFFRRTYPELEEAMQQAYDLFPSTGGHSRDNGREWQWPSGAHFRFRHINHEKDLHANQGKQMTAIGVDESTHLPMNWIRYLISRNRSTDPHIRTRMRLGTNPGNVGHMDHMKMFFNEVCPHCDPHLAPPQGDVLWDKKWHDGQPLTDPDTGERISIAYILSYVRDHNLLGDKYVARLKMQSPATAKALLEGCWKQFEGQYFDCFDPNRAGNPMVVPRRTLNEQRWTPRWVASDYGFSISVAAAHLFLHLPPSDKYPRGRVAIVDEFECQETAKDFARLLAERWILGEDGKPMEQRWMPWYLSPDSFSEDGHPDSLASQMNASLRRYGAHFNRATNDRAGGAMKMYTGLQDGELVITDNCKETIKAISSRIHDKDHENDVEKVHGDPLDDYYDSARYGYMSFETHRSVVAPVEVRIAERLKKEFAADPSTAMFNAQKVMDEETRKNKAGYYASNVRRRIMEQESKGQQKY